METTAVDRRTLLALGGAMLLQQASRTWAADPAPTPPPPVELPPNWLQARTLPLWPSVPDAASFKTQPSGGGWSPGYRRNVNVPDLKVFLPERPNGHAVLVMPGGAYWFVSVVNEGAELAPRLTARGIAVFVLTHRLPAEGWRARADVPLQDAQRALRLIRSRATEFRIDPAKVSALGFSAGGHLAATLATEHARSAYTPVDAIDRADARPFAAGLIYPVITMRKPWTHALSRSLLLGDDASEAQVDRRSAELHVDAGTPPTFLVHANDDAAVPVENSLRMLDALRKAGRPVEAHLLQEGGHAFGVGRPGTPSSYWIDLFCNWLERSR